MKEYKDYNYFTKAVPLPNGKRKYIRAKTKRELDRKVLEFQIAQANGQIVVSSSMTVAEVAELWLEKAKKPSVKPQSYRVYDERVRCHLLPAIGDMQISDVRMVHILDVVNSYGYKSKAANKHLLTTVRAIFRFAVENDIIAKSPAPDRATVLGSSMREEKPLTPNQTQALLNYCKADKHPDVYLFTYLALVTGMRRGEIAALRWDCVDFQNGLILVRRNMIDSTGEITDELKTEAAKRDIPMTADTMAFLKQVHAASISTYVVGGRTDGHISSNDIRRYDKLWKKSGVAPQTIHAHLFRKTFATRLIETGTDPKRVQYLLGHTTLDMTLRIYAKYDQESQTEATRGLMEKVFDKMLKMG